MKRLCVECRWCVTSIEDAKSLPFPGGPKCNRADLTDGISVVTGEEMKYMTSCLYERTGGRLLARLSGICGTEARFFERRIEVRP